MSGFPCSEIGQFQDALDDQIEKCQQAYERANERADRAAEIAALAVMAGEACVAIFPVLFAPCLSAAAIAKEIAEAVEEDARAKADEAGAAVIVADGAKAEIEALEAHCDNLESWQEEAFNNLLEQAYEIAGAAVQAECEEEEVAELDEAESALDEALAAAEGGAPPDFG
jgi:hypothetical protein